MHPSNDKISPPCPVVSKGHTSNVISTKHVVNINTTHLFSETPSWVSNESSSLLPGENPSSPVAGEVPLLPESKGGLIQSSRICEHSVECSMQSQRLISKRVPILSSLDDIGEKWWIYNTVVKIQINKSEENTPEDTAASMLPLSTSIPSSICPAPTTSICPSSDELSPPVEVVPIRRILNVVNKKLSASDTLHSPYNRTVQRQSQHTSTPSSSEEGQLASAAAYIWERISWCSLPYDKSICQAPKLPPDKTTDSKSNSRWLNTLVINKEMEMSVRICSPESEGSGSPPVWPDPALQQPKTWRAEELSSEYSETILWLPRPVFDEVSIRWQRDLHTVSNMDKNMNTLSPVPNKALMPFYSSASAYPAQAHPPSQPRHVLLGSHRLVHSSTQSSLDLDWLHTSRQCPWDVINMSIRLASAIWYSPESKTEGTNPSPFSSKTRRSPQHIPSSPQLEAPWHFNGAVIQQRDLCAISNMKMRTTQNSHCDAWPGCFLTWKRQVC